RAGAAAQAVRRDRVADRLAVLPGRMDAAGRHRRDDAGGVAGQDHAVPGEWRHRTAAGNQAGAHTAGRRACWQPEPRTDAFDQRAYVGYAGAGWPVAEGQPQLYAGGRLRRPADVAGSEPAVDEAVQGARFGQSRAGVLVLDAVQERADPAEPGACRHARLRPVGPDQPARAAEAVDLPAVAVAACTGERLHQPQVDAGRA